MGWVPAGLALLLCAAVLLLLAPMRVSVRAGSALHPRLRVRVGLLWGIVPAVTVFRSGRPGRKIRKKRRAGQRRARASASRRGGRALEALREAPALLGRLGRCVRLERLDVDGRFGFTDPAATGEVFGILSPVLFGLPAGGRVRLAVVPDFSAAVLDGRAEAAVMLFPGGMVAAGARFAWRIWGPRR